MSHRKQLAFVSLGSASVSLILFILYVASCGTNGVDTLAMHGDCDDNPNPCIKVNCSGAGITNAGPQFKDDETECELDTNKGRCEQGICKLDCEPDSCACKNDKSGNPVGCPTPTNCMEWKCDAEKTCTPIPYPKADDGQKDGDCERLVVRPADGAKLSCPDDTDVLPATDCQSWICEKGVPRSTPKEQSQPCAYDAIQQGVCDGNGKCVRCLENGNQGCDLGSGEYCHQNACVNCKDGMNGDEEGPDCGGAHCGICQGKACTPGDKPCSTGYSCKDNVCCDGKCDSPCFNCAPDGICKLLLAGSRDDDTCTPTQICGGKVGEGCFGQFNSVCSSNPECASDDCAGSSGSMKCAKGIEGKVCFDSADCRATCDIDTHKCVKSASGGPCIGNGDCTSGSCIMNTKLCS